MYVRLPVGTHSSQKVACWLDVTRGERCESYLVALMEALSYGGRVRWHNLIIVRSCAFSSTCGGEGGEEGGSSHPRNRSNYFEPDVFSLGLERLFCVLFFLSDAIHRSAQSHFQP